MGIGGADMPVVVSMQIHILVGQQQQLDSALVMTFLL